MPGHIAGNQRFLRVAEGPLDIAFEGNVAAYLHVVQLVADKGTGNHRQNFFDFPVTGLVVQIGVDVVIGAVHLDGAVYCKFLFVNVQEGVLEVEVQIAQVSLHV